MSAESRVDDLLSLWQERHARGEDVPATELCRECPELLPDLERRLLALRHMHNMLPSTQDPLATASADKLPPVQVALASSPSSTLAG
jgi:hypothetical protein